MTTYCFPPTWYVLVAEFLEGSVKQIGNALARQAHNQDNFVVFQILVKPQI